MVGTTQDETDSSPIIAQKITGTSPATAGGRIRPTTEVELRMAETSEETTDRMTNSTTGAELRVTDLIEAIEQGLTNQFRYTNQGKADPSIETAQGTLFSSTGNTDPCTVTTNGNVHSYTSAEQEVPDSCKDNTQEITHPSVGEPQVVASNVAIVTGASRGMGRSFASQLLAIGYKVCIADITEGQGLHTCEQLADQHGHENVTFVKCDVTQDGDFEKAWTVCLEKFGPVTLLVNNAGVGNETNWPLTLNVNIGGCIRGTNLAMEKMDKSKGGQGGIVINIASLAGLQPHFLGPVYSATKHAIIGFTRSMGDDFYYKKTNVKVMCLCPSLVETEFLSDSAQNASSGDVQMMLKHADANLPKLEVEEVDKALVKLIIDGKNGSVLVVEKGKNMKYVESKL